MKLFHGIILAAGILLSTTASFACPLGEREDHLTIQRVMRNLGRFVMPAEWVALKGANPNETVTDADLHDAAEKLSLAISCTQAVLANPTGDLLPDKASFKEGQELVDYVKSYVYFMEEFQSTLIDLRELIVKTQATPANKRDFQSIKIMCDEIDDVVNHAHKKL